MTKGQRKPFRVAVFISGRGSNLRAIYEAIQRDSLDIEIVLVLSSTKKAAGLEFAKNCGIPTVVVPRRTKELSQSRFDEALVEAVSPSRPDLVVLAGFMRVVGGNFISAFPSRVINIHPSLLPAFPGLNVQQQAIDAGVRFSGCTVHYVSEAVDAGPIIAQAVVPVLPNDSAQDLASRILVQEHKLLPTVVRAIAESRILLENTEKGPTVSIDDGLLGASENTSLSSLREPHL